MKNSIIRVTFGGCTVVAKNDERRLELEIPSGIEFRMEGDWGHDDRLSKREIKDLVDKVVDKAVEKIPSTSDPVSTAASAEELEHAYKQGMLASDNAFREEVRMNIAANNAAIQEIGKSISALTEIITTVAEKVPTPAPATMKKSSK